MTTDLATARRRRATVVAGIAGIVVAVAAVTVAIDARSRSAEQMSGPVLPEFAQLADETTKITVVSPEARYEISKTQKGWALKDRGNYPVRRERLAQFTEGLKSLRYVRAMTRDPEKVERLGLGDPTKSGGGVLVEVEGVAGARLADLIIGGRPGGGLFARKPDDPRTFEVKGTLPPLRNPALWLDLQPFAIAETNVAGVEVYPEAGPGYKIERANDQDKFALAPPFAGAPVSPLASLPATATALAALQPVDVMPVAALTGAPVARARMRTFDGLYFDAEFVRFAESVWVKLVARSDDPARAGELAKLNELAAPWAYKLSTVDYATIAPTAAQITAPPEPPPALPTP